MTVRRLLRIEQWTKNLFVLPAPLFGHALTSPHQAACVGLAFLSFCLLSSAVYAFNDVLDAGADRHHPTKSLRPVASGAVSPAVALSVAVTLVGFALALSWPLGPGMSIVVCVYLANNLAYNFLLKRRVIADVLSIALGFLLRIIAGAVAVDVEPSSWLQVCGFSLALFLGFCKRRSECGAVGSNESVGKTREVLVTYSIEKLNLLCASTATLTLVTYMLFTVSAETVERHGTTALIYTLPFVVYCVLRYLMKALEARGEDAVRTLFRDAGFLAAGVGWGIVVTWILYLR